MHCAAARHARGIEGLGFSVLLVPRRGCRDICVLGVRGKGLGFIDS